MWLYCRAGAQGIEGEEWWKPLKKSHGQQIAAQLLTKLRQRWNTIPRREADGWLPMPALGVELGPGTWLSGGMVHQPGQIIAHEGHHQVVSLE